MSLVVLLIVAALIRLVLLVLLSSHLDRSIAPDTVTYQIVASHLWSDLWSPTTTELYFTLLRAPGYPLLLAALGQQTLWVLVVQIAMSLLLVAIVYRMALPSMGQAGALVAAGVVALEPVGMTYDFMLLTEAPFALALTLGLALWLKGLRERSWPWLAAAGATIGASTLIRPVSLYLIVVLLPITALRMRRDAPVLACLVLAATFAIPVSVWLGRNVALTGHPVFSTVGAFDLADYRAAYAVADEDHVTVEQARQSIRRNVTASESDPAVQADQLTRAGIAALVSHPKGWVQETSSGAAYLLLGAGDNEWRALFGLHTSPTTAFGYAISFGLLILAISGGVFALGSRQWELISLGSVLVYMVAVSSGGESNARLRVPIEPLIALLAAYAVVTLRRRWMTRRNRIAAGSTGQ